MTPLELGWVAGIIDGEGSVVLEKRGKYRQPLLLASSTDMEILEELKLLLGGSITEKREKRKDVKRSWMWRLNGSQQVLLILERLTPLLRCPKKQKRATFLIKKYNKVTSRNGYYTSKEARAKVQFETKFFTLQ